MCVRVRVCARVRAYACVRACVRAFVCFSIVVVWITDTGYEAFLQDVFSYSLGHRRDYLNGDRTR